MLWELFMIHDERKAARTRLRHVAISLLSLTSH